LENVHYRYPGASTEALRGISLRINAATTVAFIGTSGAGKSTLIDTILGLLTPTDGSVLIDGHNAQDDLPAWQRQIGYVPQDIYLIDDSIRRNIAFGISDAQIDDLAVARAVKAAQIESLIQSLPRGLETPVGHEGIRLSGGQRQRIAIARALYHDPSVLVLDEATNALDEETERELIDAVDGLRGDRTIVIVAHRLTTVRHCDIVFLLGAGTLRDQGSFGDLAARHPNLRETLTTTLDMTQSVA
jgi:ATP-binding cassette subfamily C protein